MIWTSNLEPTSRSKGHELTLPALPEPENGMVARFNYRWADERAAMKERPACIAMVRDAPDPRGDTIEGPTPLLKQVVYLAITSQIPRADRKAVEIPAAIGSRLGLKYSRCWVVVSECNVQYWPNDISRVPGSEGRWHYGFLTPRFFKEIQNAFREEIIRRKANIMNVHFLPPRR